MTDSHHQKGVDAPSKQQLHSRLRDFYSHSPAYFSIAAEANSELTPERSHVFRWIQNGNTVVDIGCGPCDNAIHLRSARYIGVDVSPLALQIARERSISAVAGLVAAESHRLPIRSASADVVLSTYSLEHIVFVEESLLEMWRICKPEGLIILVSPAYDNPLQLPPSASHLRPAARALLRMRRIMRSLKRHLGPGSVPFELLEKPRVLQGEYQSDFDAVHLVSARDIGFFFTHRGGEVVFQRSRSRRPLPSPASGLRHFIKELLRNSVLSCGWGTYANLNLQCVIRRPAK